MVRAGIYIRVSKAKRELLDAQRQQPPCEAFIQAQGWTVQEIYMDDSISAYTGAPREHFERLLSDVRAGKLDAIVSWQMDRLLRTVEDASAIVAIAKQTGVLVANVGGSIDLSTADGRKRFYEAAVAAQYESDLKSERLKLKHAEIAATGGWQGGQRPFGFDLVPFQDHNRIKYKPVLNPEEALAIHQAATDVLQGTSVSSIVNRWAQGTVRRTNGGLFDNWQIKSLLTNPRIAGFRKVDDRLVQATWEAIITREQLEELQAILGPTRPHGGGTGGLLSARTYLLRGFVVCANCGTLLRAKASGGRRRYVCATRDGGCGGIKRVAEPLEDWVVSRLLWEVPGRLLKATQSPEGASETETLGALLRRRATEEDRLEGLADYLTDGTLSKAEYLRQKHRIQGRLTKLEQEITRLRAQAPRRRLKGAHVHEYADAWSGMDLNERRLVLADHITRITVKPVGPGRKRFDPESVEITWKS
jgi:DNA invertase Pin-like site-specific DNA recombinase